MADLKQMDYNTKILNFLTMTETGDQEVAIQYLSSVNWDETKAVNKFFSKIKPNSSRTIIIIIVIIFQIEFQQIMIQFKIIMKKVFWANFFHQYALYLTLAQVIIIER